MTVRRAFFRAFLPVCMGLAATALHAQPDLTISKSHSFAFTQNDVGDQYTITVTNIGNFATVGQVTVTEFVPGGLIPTGIAGGG
jgi:uncharacterized repeat protein (TIGR01451 family)